MVGGSKGLGASILNKITQQVYQQLKKNDSNYSVRLDLNEIQKKNDVTGNGQKLEDNSDSLDAYGKGELIAFREKSSEGKSELLNQLESIFQQSGISTDTIAEFLKGQTNHPSDLTSLLQTGTNLGALNESRVQETLDG